jgi:hypothetical protein
MIWTWKNIFWFVSSFELVDFVINSNYYVSLVIFQTYKNAVLKNVHSFGWFLWLCFYRGFLLCSFKSYPKLKWTKMEPPFFGFLIWSYLELKRTKMEGFIFYSFWYYIPNLKAAKMEYNSFFIIYELACGTCTIKIKLLMNIFDT